MKKDAVIGVVTNMSWPQLRAYAVSLTRCGFAGEKILFVNNITPEAVTELENRNFTLIEYDMPDCFDGRACDSQVDVPAWTGFGQYRYKPVIDFMTPIIGKYRYIIWTDVRDLMFQLDPIEWMEENLKAPFKLIAAREGWRIKDQPHNDQWARFTTPEDYPWLRENEVLCAGCVAGTADIMLELFNTIWKASRNLDLRANDQGIFNWVLRKDPFRDICIVPNLAAGFVATGWSNKRFLQAAYSTDDPPVFNVEDYIVYTPDGSTPFCIVHQYDRDANWTRCIDMIMEAAE